MTFNNEYPYSPPTFKFNRPIYHPNIYPDGKLCISILHAPGADEMSGELATERWSPLQCAESVLRSILLLLDDPEVSSPANVDAGVLYRKDRAAYIQKAAEDVSRSKQDIPASFIMPESLEEAPPEKMVEDQDFWAESDAEDDFGGSDSSGEDEDGMGDFDEDDGDQEFEESGEEEQEEAE
jgi:ubiquitin-conjugating enzyme E2 R